MWLPKGISQVRDSTLKQHFNPEEPLTSPQSRQKLLHIWRWGAFPFRPIWWSPPLLCQTHCLCNCAKLLGKDVHHGSVYNSENQMQTPWLSLGLVEGTLGQHTVKRGHQHETNHPVSEKCKLANSMCSTILFCLKVMHVELSVNVQDNAWRNLSHL